MPHAPADDVGRRQGGFDPAGCPAANELHFFGSDGTVVLDGRDHGRIGQAAARIEVVLEAANPLREDLDVAFAAPLAVRDLVQPGPFLQGDGGLDGPVEEPRGFRLGQLAGFPVEDHVPNPCRTRQAADDRCREKVNYHCLSPRTDFLMIASAPYQRGMNCPVRRAYPW